MVTKMVVSGLLLCSAFCVLEIGANCPFECICERTFSICRAWRPNAGHATGITSPTIDLSAAEVLPGGVLPFNLSEINLQGSPIMSISEDAFDDSATTLTTLSFVNCRFTKIPDALLHLHTLNYLTISDTNIQDWNIDAMSAIGPKMMTLLLSNVGLNSWPSWMKYFTNLTDFSFGGSSISSIPDDAFDLMNAVTSLSLYNNKLRAVPKALSRLTNLQSLGLDDNIILDLTWLPKSSPLSSLSLGGNRLSNSTHLSQALLPYANSLTDVSFQGNQLTSIPNLDFLIEVDSLDFSSNMLSYSNVVTFPAKLDELDLSSNLFSSIPGFTLTLKFVTSLSMSSNRVTAIKGTDFAASITYVQLDKNLITQLTDTSFPQGSVISSLVLDYNPLMTISHSAFTNLPSLTYLSVRNSHLTRLPLALASLRKLTTFDITGSRDLVCTCLEKSLEPWVMSMSTWSLMGDCGQTSIYFFFTALSPGCPVL